MIGRHKYYFNSDIDWKRASHTLNRGANPKDFRWSNHESEYGDHVDGDSQDGITIRIEFENDPPYLWWSADSERSVTDEEHLEIEQWIEAEILPAVGASNIRKDTL